MAAELRAKGVARDDADAAIAGLGAGGEEAAARAVVRRLVHPGAEAAELQRVVAKLIRRGFPAGVAWSVTREAAREARPPD